jgi:hypothetical protein
LSPNRSRHVSLRRFAKRVDLERIISIGNRRGFQAQARVSLRRRHSPRPRQQELAVRDLIHGRPVRNLEALANPEAMLLDFRDRPELKD